MDPAERQRGRQKEIERLEKDVEELRRLAPEKVGDEDLERLRREVAELKKQFLEHLGPWQRAQLARHPQRPYTLDFIRLLFTDFVELHGDRGFGDDKAIITGLAKFHGRPVVVLGHQKGRDTKQRVVRNFGQPKPEGYRKALRVMQLAAKFRRPVFTFVDTQGAYPGIDAEERGQAEAIARNLREMARLPVPIIVTITGEGGSGGALAIAVGDRVNILENAFYSVISPEGCAAIMWRNSAKAETAAAALKISARELKELGLVDEIVPEPDAGAHTDHEAAARLLDGVLERNMIELTGLPPDDLIRKRYDKFRQMGQFFDLRR
ncbi:MAG: acetyl-CoA carboxylase carboxyl transferase subunit alpha [Acidobacteria bacterium]|nr:MAG: acetyl-CoA carboxylase carboxyl transferase subunit alpha [Acidobacteriota bacterium]